MSLRSWAIGFSARTGRAAGIARLAYRLVSPFFTPWRSAQAIARLPWFVASAIRYHRLSDERIPLLDLYPNLTDRDAGAGVVGGHYFHQDLWAARKVFSSGKTRHHDVGSRIDGFVAHCAVFAEVVYVDFRPVDAGVARIEWRQGDILALPFDDRSIQSLSCLHVAEHVGLGRYGDPLNPRGTSLAMAELQRVLRVGGDLYFGIPIGRPRVCYNAHRVVRARDVVAGFGELELKSFDAVDDSGAFVPSPALEQFDAAEYACGLFHFKRQT